MPSWGPDYPHPGVPTCSERILGLNGKRLRFTSCVASELADRGDSFLTTKTWSAGPLSICLSVCQERSSTAGLPQHLISGSLPSQLDEEEERRKRRREKNKVAAARCRNKKKERTEFLQRVSRAAGQGGEWACTRVD